MRFLMLVVLLGGALFAQTPTSPVTEQRDPSLAPSFNSWQYSKPLSGGMLFAQTPTPPVTDRETRIRPRVSRTGSPPSH